MDGRNEVESGVISRVALKRSRTHVEKGVAWAILALSWVGTVATANGGWESLLTTFSLGATVAGLAGQGILTWLQWAYEDVWYIAWPARLIDAALTALGYGFLFVGGLAATIALTGLSTTLVPWGWWIVTTCGLFAWAIIYLVSLVAAWYPEHTLVR